MRSRFIAAPPLAPFAAALVAGFVATPASTAAAQSAPRAPTTQIQRDTTRRHIADDSTWRNRATLGMSLSATGSKRDTLGIFVTRVVPGGPAERAGIIEGDRIATIDDIDLRLTAGDADDAYTAAVPAHRLSRTVSKLKPGNAVSLRVYSDGHYRNVSVTTGSMADVYKNHERIMFSLGDMNEMIAPALDEMSVALDQIGPELDRMRPELERIGPMVREQVERAMDSLPHDIHVEIKRDNRAH